MIINLKHISSDQNRQAMLSNQDSVAIVISYSGEEQEINRIVNYIKEKYRLYNGYYILFIV